MAAPLFELITELQATIRRDFPVAVPGILNPLDAAPLVEGEWLELNSSYQLVRGAAGVGKVATVFPIHTEKGRYDTQAIGKANVLFLGMYEAETLVHDALAGGVTIGDPLMVTDCTVGGVANRRGLAVADGTDDRVIVGFVTKIVGSGQTARLRFVHMGNYKVSAV